MAVQTTQNHDCHGRSIGCVKSLQPPYEDNDARIGQVGDQDIEDLLKMAEEQQKFLTDRLMSIREEV